VKNQARPRRGKPRHERIILRRICENHEFGASDAIPGPVAISFKVFPSLMTASIFIPAMVEATFRKPHTLSVQENTSGSESISRSSALVIPFWTSAP